MRCCFVLVREMNFHTEYRLCHARSVHVKPILWREVIELSIRKKKAQEAHAELRGSRTGLLAGGEVKPSRLARRFRSFSATRDM